MEFFSSNCASPSKQLIRKYCFSRSRTNTSAQLGVFLASVLVSLSNFNFSNDAAKSVREHERGCEWERTQEA